MWGSKSESHNFRSAGGRLNIQDDRVDGTDVTSRFVAASSHIRSRSFILPRAASRSLVRRKFIYASVRLVIMSIRGRGRLKRPRSSRSRR